MDPQVKKPQGRKLGWFWWVIMGALLIWNVYSYFPRAKPNLPLPYSDFLTQVDKNNVASVQLSGSEITGTLINPIPGSAVTITTPSATAQPTATPATLYTSFVTTFPDVQGDPNLIGLLHSHNVLINVATPPNPIWSILLTFGLPLVVFVGIMVWFSRRANSGMSGIASFGRSKAREYTLDRPKVSFGDVAGVDEAKQDLKEVVDFLRNPDKYHKVGAHIPHGVLLVGPPGTGKTLLARAVAGEAGVPFFSISASEFVEMFVGVGASRVRDLFEQAKKVAPSIVFIDELDAVGRRRGTGLGNVNDEREQTLNQLLVGMDGFDENRETILLAATNRSDVLDPALLRPGRFDRQVFVGLPDKRGREGILKIHTRDLNLAPDVDLNTLAQSTTGFSGADLANLCNEAALIAARENHDEIARADFEAAVDRVVLGAPRSILLNQEEKRIVAYHESGHALVAWLTPIADAVHKVTIIPHGQALGVTEQLPGEDRYNYSRDYLLARLAVMLGGRVAEEVAMDDITTGAENDLVQATNLARRMVTHWGMGSLGTMALATDENTPFLGFEMAQGREYSEATAARIDQDVQALLEERHQFVTHLIEGASEKLDLLAETLLTEETLDQEEIGKILGAKAEVTRVARIPRLNGVHKNGFLAEKPSTSDKENYSPYQDPNDTTT
jgi:cell division protease FtsH